MSKRKRVAKPVGRPPGSKDQIPRKRQSKPVPPPSADDVLADLRRRAVAAKTTEECVSIHKTILKLEAAARPPRPHGNSPYSVRGQLAAAAVLREQERKQAATAALQQERDRRNDRLPIPVETKVVAGDSTATPTPAAEQQARTDKPAAVDPMDVVEGERHKVGGKAEAAQADKVGVHPDKQVGVNPDPQTAAVIAATLGSVNPTPTGATRTLTPGDEGADTDFERRVRERMYRQANVNRGSCDYNELMYSVKTLREREEDFPEPVQAEEPTSSFTGFPEGRG